MGQPGVASVTWDDQSRPFSPDFYKAVGQQSAPAGTTYTASENDLKTLKALPPIRLQILRKNKGLPPDYARYGMPMKGNNAAANMRHTKYLGLVSMCSMRAMPSNDSAQAG